MFIRLFALFCLLLSAGAYAQNTGLPIRYFFPSQGFWISTSLVQDRNSYGVQVGPDGFVFVAIYTYDTLGLPTFLTLQGQLQPATVAERATGLMSSFESPVYRTQGGTPFGTSMPSSPQTAETSFGPARIRFFIGERGEFSFAGQTLTIKPFPLYTSPTAFRPENIAKGVWSFGQIGVLSNGQLDRAGLYTVGLNIQPTTVYSPSSPTAGPAPGSVQYRFACLACFVISSSGELDINSSFFRKSSIEAMLLSFDSTSGRWLLHSISQGNYGFSGYVEVGYSTITHFFSGSDAVTFMTRVPDNFGLGGIR
jgi:hypothetical protein